MSRKYIQNCTGDECQGHSSKKSRSSGLFSRIIFYILLVGFVGVSIYVLFFSPYLQITSVVVSGNQELNSADIQQRIGKSLEGKYLGILPKNNFLLISQSGIAGFLKNDFKKIRSVSIAKKFPDSLEVNVGEYKALMVWCSGDQCYLIDENGVAYGTADFNSPELAQNHLLKLTDASSKEVSVGEKILEPDYVQYALSVREAGKNVGLEMSEEYLTPSRVSEEVDAVTTGGTQIMLSTQFTLDSAMTTLGMVLKKQIPNNEKDNIAYIDLRTENKAFYKFKDAQPAPDAVPADNSVKK